MESESMRFGLLGPLRVWVDDRAVALGGPKNQAVMAALLLRANSVVTVSQLIACVWGDGSPEHPDTQVRNRVSTLRRMLRDGGAPADMIKTQGTGYLLCTDETQLDVNEFERRVHESDQQAASGCPEEAVNRLADALTLWRGPALDGLRNGPLDAASQRLDERRLTVLCRRIELELALGRQERVIAELTELVQTYPWHERFSALLMAALYAAGRRHNALDCFERTRRLLADELGVDPGPLLYEMRDRVLRDDPDLKPATKPVIPPPARLLPPDLADLVGRRAEIDALVRACTPAPSSTTFVIHGLPGVGKTSLATRVAHLLRPTVPGAELYIDLRGDGAAADPAEVLLRLLRMLDVDRHTIPTSLEERATLFRRTVAHQRCLLLLDNAASSSQVRPLLPGGNAVVLVTSRRALFDLDGAQRLKLRPLALDEAVKLVGHVIGPARVAAERAAAEAIAHNCGMLPLGLRLSATRLAARPHITLAQAAAQMADLRHRLDYLTHPDRDVRTALNSTYTMLSEHARRMLRGLALLDPPDGSGGTCATVTAQPSLSDDPLAELVEANLVDILEPDSNGQRRWRLHDLVRAFARERAKIEDPPDERSETPHRVFAAWSYSAGQAVVSSRIDTDGMTSRVSLGHQGRSV